MPHTPDDAEEQAAFQLRISAGRRDELDRTIAKWKGKGVLPTKASRNDMIDELIAVYLEAPAAEQERIARRIAARRG